MFKFRFGGQGGSSPAQAPLIEVVRRRARHRLIGAFVLVVAGVIGFPLLFESQPRPVPANFEIDIPAKNGPKSLGGASPAVSASVSGAPVEGLDGGEELVAPTSAPAAPAPKPALPVVVAPPVVPVVPVARPAATARQEPVSRLVEPVSPVTKVEPKPVVKPEADTKPAAKVEAKPAAKADVKPVEHKEHKPAEKPASDALRAQSLLEDKPASKASHSEPPAGKGRIVVQVGAFADADRAREVRQKLERAGLVTYVHVADTPGGKRTRVRVGPFSSRAEADQAAAKVKALGLPAAVLTL